MLGYLIMQYDENSPFYKLLATKYKQEEEALGIAIVEEHPEIVNLIWPDPDDKGQPFVKGSTALHYAANDGKDKLVLKLIEHGSDVNASDAQWYRSVLSWAANNAQISTIRLLLANGADSTSLDAVHAAAFGGSSCGEGKDKEYAETLQILIDAGADLNDRRHYQNQTPLGIALNSGNIGAIEYLRSINAAEV